MNYNKWQTPMRRPVPPIRSDWKIVKWVAILLIALLVITFIVGISSQNAPPMHGRIVGKVVQTGLLPKGIDSDVAYCLLIKSDDGQSGSSWYVDEKTYLKYKEGDRV